MSMCWMILQLFRVICKFIPVWNLWRNVLCCKLSYYDMIWYDMIWYDTIWYDVLWHDMMYYGTIWYGLTLFACCSILCCFRNFMLRLMMKMLLWQSFKNTMLRFYHEDSMTANTIGCVVIMFFFVAMAWVYVFFEFHFWHYMIWDVTRWHDWMICIKGRTST